MKKRRMNFNQEKGYLRYEEILNYDSSKQS